MIAPLTPLPIRGVICHQGESNTDTLRAPLYQQVFETLITDWRNQWRQQTLPFLYVQISSFKSPDNWAAVREAQRKTLELRGTGMAVTVDINSGHHIHPADKQDVGHRLALWARNLVYGEAVEDSGPLFATAVPEGNEMVITFTHAEGLHSQGVPVEGFEVAGDDANFLPATTRIENQRVYASNPQILHPRYVRYGWSSIPDGNLFNQDGLPASPFMQH